MKSAVGLGVSAALEAVLPLVRLIILARFLPQNEFGLAVTLLVTLGIIEMCGDMGIAQAAIRGSTRTSIPAFIGTLHFINFVRCAAMIAVAVVVLTVQRMTLDTTFGVDIVVICCLVLALRPFENMHMKQLTRSYNFAREAVLTGGMQIVWTLVTTACVMVKPGGAAMFYGMLAGAAWVVLYSNHISAERWTAELDQTAAREALRFGVPMIPNGLASAVFTMDRLVVSSFLGTLAVAVYGVAIGLAMLPRAVIYRFSVAAIVPHFANLADRPEKGRGFYALWLIAVSVLAACYALALIVLGPFAIRITFGPAYVPNDLLMALIAINAFIKIMMLVPVPAAFARGQTTVVLLGSLVSAVSTLPAALALLLGMRSLETFVLALDIFEGLGLVWFLLHTSRRHGLRRAVAFGAVAAPLVALGSITAAAWTRF